MSSVFVRRPVRAAIALAASALAVACGSDAPTRPPSNSSLDLASVFSEMSAGGLDAYAGARALIGVPATPAAPTVIPAACAYSSSTQSFVCPTASANGLTLALTYYLYDAAGHTQSAADVKTTDGVRTVSDVKGTVTSPASSAFTGTMNIDDHSDLTLKGLLGTTRTLNGTSKSHLELNGSGTAASHSVDDVTTTTTNVVLPAKGSSNPWPASGTISSDLNSTTQVGTSSLTLALHSVITFNGTSVVTIATTVAGHTTTCQVDLSGKTAPVC